MKRNTNKEQLKSDSGRIGALLPAKSYILRTHVGEAQAGKLKYEMSTTMQGQPIVRSKQTGVWFTMSWQTIINLAVEAGIDKEEKDDGQGL